MLTAPGSACGRALMNGPFDARLKACSIEVLMTLARIVSGWSRESTSIGDLSERGVRENRPKLSGGWNGSSGRTRTCNLVVTSAPEFLLGLDYLFTRPE